VSYSVGLPNRLGKRSHSPRRAGELRQARHLTRVDIDAAIAAIRRRARDRSLLVGLSGIDGSGKSTQVKIIRDGLIAHGIDAVSLRHRLDAAGTINLLAQALTGNRFAYHPMIPATLRSFVIACDTVADYNRIVTPHLVKGRVVLWDRSQFCFSCYAEAYGADMHWVDKVLGLIPAPDLIILLDLPAEAAYARLEHRRGKPIRSDESVDVLRRARRVYLRRAGFSANVRVVSAIGSIDDVTERIWEAMATELSATMEKP